MVCLGHYGMVPTNIYQTKSVEQLMPFPKAGKEQVLYHYKQVLEL